MARDDFHVIVYQMLSYLYQALKKGETVNKEMIDYDSPLYAKINKKYWAYIIYNMHELGLIKGIDFVNVDGLDVPLAVNLEKCAITPHGIEYLTDNSFMEKAKRFLKDIKEIVPFT